MDQLFWFFSRNLILLTIWTHHFTKANMNWKLHQNCFFSISFLCVGKKSSYFGYLILTLSGWWQHLRVMTTFIHQLWCFFIISMHAKKKSLCLWMFYYVIIIIHLIMIIIIYNYLILGTWSYLYLFRGPYCSA